MYLQLTKIRNERQVYNRANDWYINRTRYLKRMITGDRVDRPAIDLH